MHRKFNQNIYLELSLHEVCTLDLIFQNSSLFEWWRPCLKNLRNVISLVSFLVLAVRLEIEKSGFLSHHLKSPFSMTLAGKNKTESLQADECYHLFRLIFSTEVKALGTTGLQSQNLTKVQLFFTTSVFCKPQNLSYLLSWFWLG